MNLLNRTECSALRGVAIVEIFMHNYLHWLNPMVKENEYMFHEHKVNRMISILMNPASDIVMQLFSFFGHYGVPVFLFLSGYGLVKKYERDGAEKQGVWKFTKIHYQKLFPMMLLGFVAFAMVDWMTPGHHHWTWMDIVGHLTMTINLFPEPNRVIWPGQYWFFGLMMQLYLVYRLMMYKRHWGWTVGLIAVCTLIQAMFFENPESDILNRIRYNGIGGMLPFGLGVLIARYKGDMEPVMQKHWTTLCFVVFTAAVVLFSMTFFLWLWVPLIIVVMHVCMVKILPQVAIKGFDWLGVLSAAIFVCHPITRKIFIPISRMGDIEDGLMLFVVSTIMLAMLFRMVIKKLSES